MQKVTVTSDDGQSETLRATTTATIRPASSTDRTPARPHRRHLYAHGRLSGTNLHGRHDRPRTDPPAGTARRTVCDSLFTLQALFDDPPAKNAYFAECRTTDPGAYSPALMGVVDDSVLDNGGSVTLTVNRPLQYLKIKDYKQYFRPGETVDVRFSHISSPTFNFWSRLENEMLNAMNPVFPAYENLPSNIKGDARGIWSGYGSSYYRITMPQKNDCKETTVFPPA